THRHIAVHSEVASSIRPGPVRFASFAAGNQGTFRATRLRRGGPSASRVASGCVFVTYDRRLARVLGGSQGHPDCAGRRNTTKCSIPPGLIINRCYRPETPAERRAYANSRTLPIG